jgi:hypothetical protein
VRERERARRNVVSLRHFDWSSREKDFWPRLRLAANFSAAKIQFALCVRAPQNATERVYQGGVNLLLMAESYTP